MDSNLNKLSEMDQKITYYASRIGLVIFIVMAILSYLLAATQLLIEPISKDKSQFIYGLFIIYGVMFCFNSVLIFLKDKIKSMKLKKKIVMAFVSAVIQIGVFLAYFYMSDIMNVILILCCISIAFILGIKLSIFYINDSYLVEEFSQKHQKKL